MQQNAEKNQMGLAKHSISTLPINSKSWQSKSIDKSDRDIFSVTHHHVRDLQHFYAGGMDVSEIFNFTGVFPMGSHQFSSHSMINARDTQKMLAS